MRPLVLLLCLLLVAGCGGGDDEPVAATTTATLPVETLPTAPATTTTAGSKAVLTGLLAEQGIPPGRTTDADLLEPAWAAFRAFAGVENSDPFLADPELEEGDALRFEAVTDVSERYGETSQLRFARRYRLEDFAGQFDRQEEVVMTLHFKPTDTLARAGQGGLWSSDREAPDQAGRIAAWERVVEATPAFQATLAEGEPVAVEVTVQEGDIH